LSRQSRLACNGRGNSIELAPGPVARAFGCFRGAAASRIASQRAAKSAGRLVAEPLKKIAAEIKHRLPDERSELIVVGTGVSDADGVGDGLGDGDCAAADVDDNAAQGVSVRNAASAIAATIRFLFREGRDAQHINTIPEKEHGSSKNKNPVGRSRFALSSTGGSIGRGPKLLTIGRNCASTAQGVAARNAMTSG